VESVSFFVRPDLNILCMRGDTIPDTWSHTPTLTVTPDLTQNHVLLVACISARSLVDNRILSRRMLSNLRIFPSNGVCSKEYITCDMVESMSIHLSPDSLTGASYMLSVEVDGKCSQIHVPLNRPGCRYSYYVVKSVGISLCLVQDAVLIRSDTEHFIEEQDFLFSCMEIQEEIFMGENGPLPLDETHVQPELHQLSPRLPLQEQSEVCNEIRVMQSLIAKYEQTRASRNSTPECPINSIPS
jgi:hypothetical protein